MSLVDEAIDDLRLRFTCEKIAEGIAKLKQAGLPKEAIIEGLRRQVEHEFEEASKC